MKIRIQNELWLINLTAILLVIIIILFPFNTLRVILGLPFLFFFPGYALVAALFPRKSQLGNIERVAFSFGLSIAVILLIGLILNATPWGVTLYPSLLSLTIFIFINSVIAWYQRRRLAEVEKFTISFNLSFAHWMEQSFAGKVVSIFFIAAIVGAIGTIGYVIAVPKTHESFTEFYLLGLEGKAESYIEEVRVGEETGVIVGIINREQETVSYRLEVRIDGVRNYEVGGIIVEHDKKWEQEVIFMPSKAERNQKVEFLLYKDGEAEPYLEPLRLWLDAIE